MSEKRFTLRTNSVSMNYPSGMIFDNKKQHSLYLDEVVFVLNEQQDTITGFQEKIFELRDDKEQLHTEISKLRQEVAELKTRNAVLSSHLHRIPPKIREVWLE